MSSSRRVLYTAFDVVPAPKGASRHITHFTCALVAAGYQVTLLQRQGAWCQVITPNNNRGWMICRALAL